MGGTRSKKLNKITRLIWEWCQEKAIFVFASYVNTKDNYIADAGIKVFVH